MLLCMDYQSGLCTLLWFFMQKTPDLAQSYILKMWALSQKISSSNYDYWIFFWGGAEHISDEL